MGDLEPAPNGYPIKLVRDGTAAKINPSGEPGELFYGPAPDGRQDWLRRKLGEEVTEYLVGRRFAELLDILAVVEALVAWHGRSFGLVEAGTAVVGCRFNASGLRRVL